MIDSLSPHCIPANTIPALFRRQADRLGPRVAVRVKRNGMYVDVSWHEWARRVEDVSRGLVALGVKPGDRVALVSENRLEWLIADLAIQSAGAITVPLHAPLGTAAVRAILADCGATLAIVSNASQAAKVADGITLVQMDGAAPLTWEQVEAMGRAAGYDCSSGRGGHGADDGDALATLVYTSGTSGQPKGVMLTHANILSNVDGYLAAMGTYSADSVFFLWLPLSHIYARTVDFFLALATGATIALAESAETAAADVALIHPTNMSSVPRFYEKLLALVRPLEPAERVRRLRSIFGPNIRWLNSGGAALAPGVAEAYAEAGYAVVVGYGLTEFSPVISTNRPDANRLGTVGQALPNVEVRIADDGEVLARGPSRMRGYWNQPAATAEAFEGDWLRTGDLGRLDDEGFLTITGRKKELIVLSSGKKVSPMPVEGRLLSSPLFEQVVVLGEGKPYLTAVIVPRPDVLRREAEARGTRWHEGWTSCPHVIAIVADHIRSLEGDVAPWERIRKFVMTARAFSVASDEMTVSSKIRRNAVAANYQAAIEHLYIDLPSR